MQHPAPIALFIYNRPEHTRRTLRFLQQNLLAEESRLFIFADAPAGDADEERVKETRKIARSISGFKSVNLTEHTAHQGLASSIINGVTQIVNEYGKIIVLEDDLLTSPYALQYFNDALQRYEAEDRVMQISGYMFPLKESAASLPETFFFRSISSWGWATWKRAWQHFEPDINMLYAQFDRQKIYDFSIEDSMNYWKQLLDFRKGRNQSWAIRWHASVFLSNGLVLHPAKSLIENIGHDGTGVHSIIENTYDVTLSRKPVTYFPANIAEDPAAFDAIKHFFKHRKGSLIRRGRKFLINQWYRLIKKRVI